MTDEDSAREYILFKLIILIIKDSLIFIYLNIIIIVFTNKLRFSEKRIHYIQNLVLVGGGFLITENHWGGS